MITDVEPWLPQRLKPEEARSVLAPVLARQEAVVLQCRAELMGAQQALTQALVLLMRLEAEHSRLSAEPPSDLPPEQENFDAEPRRTTHSNPSGRPGCGAGAGGNGRL